jgi:hypothetical protein
MYWRRHQLTFLLSCALVLLFITACDQGARVGDLQTRTETIELGDADSVNVEIRMGAGELQVSGGADDLLEATFTYNVEDLDPGATYSSGSLIVQDEDVKAGIRSLFDLDEYRNEWDLRFNEDVPMEMKIETGAGRSVLELGELTLTKLDINSGAGDVDLDLSDSQSLVRFDYDMGAGDSTFDLSGIWEKNLDVTISGGVGELTMRLPSEVGVRIDIDAGIGSIDTSGLMKEGDIYTNAAYGESDIQLNISISAGIGQINLDVE